jgi:hypothetical protein
VWIEVKGGWVWSIYFIHISENRTMKPVEIILSGNGEGWVRDGVGGFTNPRYIVRIFRNIMNTPVKLIYATQLFKFEK